MYFIKLIVKEPITPHIEEVFTALVSDAIGAVGSMKPILQNTTEGNTLTVVTPTPLHEEQGDIIADRFKQLYPGNFYLEMPGTQPELPTGHCPDFEKGSEINPYGDAPQIQQRPINKDDLRNVASRLAQWNHQRWMDKRAQAGWRYGPQFDQTTQLHPLMVPYEQLPPEHQEVDPEYMLQMLTLLQEIGIKFTR